MRVVHVFKDYYPPTFGGVEQHINEIVHSLKGLEFAVLTSSRKRDRIVEDDAGVRVIRAPELFRPFSTPVTPSWSKFLRHSGADLLHFHMPNPFGELCYLTSRTDTPMVASFHAGIIGRRLIRPLFTPFSRMFVSRARALIVGSPRLVEHPSIAGHREKVSLIPYGIDPADWSERPAASDEIRQSNPGPIVLFLGRLAYYKGVDVLIQAMTGIDATCLIVGDGPRRGALEELTGRLATRHKVKFIGPVRDEDRASYYHAADIYVLPSTSAAETFGISMLEAMACGTPVISTEVGTGTSWVNQNGQTGLVLPPGDPAILAGAIKAMLADPGRREQMGHLAQERVRMHFTRYQMLESLASLYGSI